MKSALLFATILLAVTSQPSEAALVRVDFSGTVSEVWGSVGDPVAAIGGSIQIGTPFSGYFTFDDSSAPVGGGPESGFDSAYSIYQFSSPAWAFHTEVGDYTTDSDVPDAYFPAGGYDLDVTDSELNPFFESTVNLGAVVGEIPFGSAELVLNRVMLQLWGSGPGLPLHSTALGLVPWSLVAFPNNQVVWTFENSDQNLVGVDGVIEELSVSVPEPRGASLTALALLGLVTLGFRRARS